MHQSLELSAHKSTTPERPHHFHHNNSTKQSENANTFILFTPTSFHPPTHTFINRCRSREVVPPPPPPHKQIFEHFSSTKHGPAVSTRTRSYQIRRCRRIPYVLQRKWISQHKQSDGKPGATRFRSHGSGTFGPDHHVAQVRNRVGNRVCA